MNILGMQIDENLNWKNMTTEGNKSLLANLRIRYYTLSKVLKYVDNEMKIKYTTAIFKGKYLYGIDNWGGCGLTQLKILQTYQNKTAKLVLGPKYYNKTDEFRLNRMKWLPLDKQILYNTHIRTYKSINQTLNHEITHQLVLNTNNNRIGTQKKLGTKPRALIR